ncbi:non-canonical purine NTP pyrophosphatase [Stenotrophomonas sp. Betaine-02u-21]|nr:non-canonical purine NTP pyrophosphatase [Stenotrophomonas sp. Betaine-02u-23]PKH75071.1 non-canonical purine NTP pyrophosphatase [Stenotrophomonas sp. Betaine-02u-21]PKH97543.1 non-canonical purine NTP pyrophosphatase [Stenotrophomonas sp. Bg11-02]
MKIRFMSSNKHKIDEVQRILAPVGIDIIAVPQKIQELQTEDVYALVEDKLIKAFEAIGRPLFVEHTGLYLSGLNGLPAGLTQIFWDRLKADRFASLVASLGDIKVTAKTVLGYCDGHKMHLFEGAIEGTVPKTPVGPHDFQWDCVFTPNGFSQTFAEMGSAKDSISMRRIALDKFADHLKGAMGTK